MTSEYYNKFFVKSLTDITGQGITEFYNDNCSNSAKNSEESKEFYPSGRPRLFQKLAAFVSGLESTFKVDVRHPHTKNKINSLTECDSHFQKLLKREYNKVPTPTPRSSSTRQRVNLKHVSGKTRRTEELC